MVRWGCLGIIESFTNQVDRSSCHPKELLGEPAIGGTPGTKGELVKCLGTRWEMGTAPEQAVLHMAPETVCALSSVILLSLAPGSQWVPGYTLCFNAPLCFVFIGHQIGADPQKGVVCYVLRTEPGSLPEDLLGESLDIYLFPGVCWGRGAEFNLGCQELSP